MDRLPDSTQGSTMRKYASEAGLLRAARQGPHGRSLTARTAHNMSASALRKKSDASLVRKVPFAPLRPVLANLQEVFLGTKLAVLFPAVPLAIAAQCANFGQVWVFALSLLGLVPLSERVSFLTEQIAIYTGPTVGGLLNATCGNATELIVALFALMEGKIEVVKCSLLGSVLSNLLLVLGTSLFCGGVVNLGSDQLYDRTQADVSTGLLILGVLCQSLPLMLRYAVSAGEHSVAADTTGLDLSRACSIVMLLAYVAYLFFQLKTHAQLFEPQDDDGEAEEDEQAVIGFASGLFWLAFKTVLIAILSEYVVGTIEPTSKSWGLSVSFISIILLPIVGNAAEHAGAIIFALKNKLVPLSVIVAWIAGIQMDLDFKLLETGSLFVSVIVTAFTLQDGSSHYLKGILLLLCYIVIGACFFVTRQPASHANNNGAGLSLPTGTSSAQVA
ncbi:vacuolar cation/proton exchanger 1a-like isoform X2 [Miscanthus floridulus]|uniref:vacuolar cation/proton exchanger 1a-like isoform X2 n=1 Tax=Miscanthus floridulus TaxID=154761 RepID=UPI00345879BD